MKAILITIAGLCIITGVAWMDSQSAPDNIAPALSGMVVRVVDGDSLYLDSHEPQIRLWGVDAPERDEDGFTAATRELVSLAQNERLSCEPVDRDRYGRTVARCFLTDGREVNRLMIESGTAQEYLRYSNGFYGR